jgi:hypothetical protein
MPPTHLELSEMHITPTIVGADAIEVLTALHETRALITALRINGHIDSDVYSVLHTQADNMIGTYLGRQ